MARTIDVTISEGWIPSKHIDTEITQVALVGVTRELNTIKHENALATHTASAFLFTGLLQTFVKVNQNDT